MFLNFQNLSRLLNRFFHASDKEKLLYTRSNHLKNITTMKIISSNFCKYDFGPFKIKSKILYIFLTHHLSRFKYWIIIIMIITKRYL